MTTAGSQAVNPISAAQHMFSMGTGVASSAGDASRYLGPETGTLRTDPYDRVQHTNYDYPEAVKDQTLFVKSTIEGFIMEDIEWMTTLALPWAQTDQLSVTWNEWHFTNPLADRVPHEGVSRLITSTKRQFKTHVVRRGLAFVMEADYANTAEGVEQYARNVMSIGQAVQETQNHDTVYALLTCKNYQKMWQQRFGTTTVSLSQIEDNEIETFGSVCLPEGDDRLSKVIEDHKRLMRKQGVVPNLLILWPGATIYMSMVPPMRTLYEKAGPDGVRRREIGPDSLTVFRGLPVFEARDFDVYEDSPPVQLLTRPVQVSEYYTMRFDRRNEDCSNYETKERGIVLYDENTNQWKKIGFMEAFKHANLFHNHHYSRKLVELVDGYNAENRRPQSEGMGENGVDEDMDDAPEAKPTFFLAAPNNNGNYMLLRYFGQMEMKHMTSEDVQRIGESIAGGIRGTRALDTWRDLVRLINDIESQSYDMAYFKALIEANNDRGVEDTPSNLAKHWGVLPQRQFKGNSYGSLDLPKERVNGIFPIGFANGPGFLTLAAEANKPDSEWKDVGARARDAVELMQFMIDHLTTRLPDSAALDPMGRSPWFHRNDALTTFFETVVGVRRDPLFLLDIGRIASGAEVEEEPLESRVSSGFTVSSRSSDYNIKWFTLPGTVHGIPTDEVFVGDEEEVMRAISEQRVPARGLQKIDYGVADGNVAFYSPSLGKSVSVSANKFDQTVRFTPEVQAFGMLPGGDTKIEMRVRQAYYNSVHQIGNLGTRRKLVDIVYNMGLTKSRVKMWRVVYGLNGLSEDELTAAVNKLHLSDNPSRAELTATRGEIERLSQAAPEAGWESFTMLSKKWSTLRSRNGVASGISFQAVGEDVQTVLDLTRELNGLSRSELSGGAVFDSAAVASVRASVGNEDRVAALKRDIGAALDRTTLSSDNNRFSANIGTSFELEEKDVANATYIRTPLTSSQGLFVSLDRLMGGRDVARPLAVPGDPATRNSDPLGTGFDGKEVFDGATYGKILLSSAINATNYATMAEITTDPSKRRLDDTGLVKRHESANYTAAASRGGSSTRNFSSAHFDDDDDDDYASDEDDIAQVFGRSDASAPSFKRARTSNAFIGDHPNEVDEARLEDSTLEMHRGEYVETRTPAFSARWTEANKISDALVRICAQAFLMSKCDTDTSWESMIRNDILVPMDFILWRPLIVHDMASAVLMKGGLETGANLHGGSNAAKGNDVTSKLIYYNFTFRSKAIVWKEKNVAIIENVKFEGYVGGMNTDFVKYARDLERADQKRPSIIVTAVGLNEKPLEKRMDFSGRLQVQNVNQEIDGPITWQYSSAEYYDDYCYKLSQQVAGSDPEHEDFFDRSERVSLSSYQGTQFSYNRSSGTYSRFVEPQGHLKRNMCYPGAAAILNGTAKAFKEYNYDLVRIE